MKFRKTIQEKDSEVIRIRSSGIVDEQYYDWLVEFDPLEKTKKLDSGILGGSESSFGLKRAKFQNSLRNTMILDHRGRVRS